VESELRIGRMENTFRKNDVHSALEERRGPVNRPRDDSGMCYRADRAFMTGKTRVLGVNVDGLDQAGEGNQEHAQQGQASGNRPLIGALSSHGLARRTWIIS